jgi:hypothetical protein
VVKLNHIKLNASKIARELVYRSRPRIPSEKLITYKDMQDYVDNKISIAFGRYIHGLDNYGAFSKFTRTYQSKNGVNYNIVAIPDSISPYFITEEKCTFNSYKTRDLTGEIQLQLEGYVCNARLGILKIRHFRDNTITRYVIGLDEPTAVNLIERYLAKTLLPYILDAPNDRGKREGHAWYG